MLYLPYELIELIIDIVAHSDDPNLSSTKACSLVCHDFLCHCRKHIFASITIASRPTRRPYYHAKSLSAARTKTTTVVDLYRLLDSSPDIGALIRNLGCCIQLDLTNSHKFLIFPTFKKISHLQSLDIWQDTVQPESVQTFQWNNNPFRPALLHLLQTPTLRQLTLLRIHNFVVTDLALCANLQRFEFDYLTVLDSIDRDMPEIPLRLSKISVGFRSKEAFRKICAVRCIDQQSFITYRSVIDLSVTIATPEDIDALHDLFCRCKSLVTACINVPNVNIPFTRIGLFNLLLPSIQTLKHLLIGYIYDLRNRTNDPLKSLASQLEEMKDRNSIKNIMIIVTIPPDWNSQRVPSDHSGWSDLDAVLAHSGWPKLESVSLQIDIWTCKGRSTELQSAFKQLPTTQFPNLSSKKTVLFNFSLNSKKVY